MFLYSNSEKQIIGFNLLQVRFTKNITIGKKTIKHQWEFFQYENAKNIIWKFLENGQNLVVSRSLLQAMDCLATYLYSM